MQNPNPLKSYLFDFGIVNAQTLAVRRALTMKSMVFRIACTITLLASVYAPANADVLFSDFGAGHTYQQGIGYTVSGSTATSPRTQPAAASIVPIVPRLDLTALRVCACVRSIYFRKCSRSTKGLRSPAAISLAARPFTLSRTGAYASSSRSGVGSVKLQQAVRKVSDTRQITNRSEPARSMYRPANFTAPDFSSKTATESKVSFIAALALQF